MRYSVPFALAMTVLATLALSINSCTTAFPTLADVVNHYDGHFGSRLTEQEKRDLIEFLKTI